MIEVMHQGRRFEVPAPAGAAPGDTFAVPMPAASAAATATAASLTADAALDEQTPLAVRSAHADRENAPYDARLDVPQHDMLEYGAAPEQPTAAAKDTGYDAGIIVPDSSTL